MSAERDDAPPSERAARSFTIRLGHRLRAVSAKQLPLVPRAVLRAMADRADEHGELYPALDTIAADAGTYAPTVRRALDVLHVLGWYEVIETATARRSARYRLRLDPVPRPEGAKAATRSPWRAEGAAWQGDGRRPPAPIPARGSAVVPQGDQSDPPRVALSSPTGSAVVPEDHRKITEKITETSQGCAHVRDQAQGVGQAIPFGPSEDMPKAVDVKPGEVLPLFPTDPTGTPLPASGERRKAPATVAAEQVHAAYCEARDKAGVKGRSPVLDAKRIKLVAARLKDGFTPEDLCLAARGVWCSDWHRQEGQTSLDLVLRDSAHVERFREEYDRANKPARPPLPPIPRRIPPPAPPEALARHLRDIQDRIDAAAGRPVAHG